MKKYKQKSMWPCNKSALSNEASVEAHFINRVIDKTEWPDEDVRLKESISERNIQLGTKSIPYKPDYILKNQEGNPCLVIDAKSPDVDIHDFIGQCASYCLLLNQECETVSHFILSNGFNTEVYNWKGGSPIMILRFEDFSDQTTQYKEFMNFMQFCRLGKTVEENPSDYMTLKPTAKEDAQKLFRRCHKKIWSAEKCGVNYAFMQFVKLMFLKMDSDKKVHEKYNIKKGSSFVRAKKEDVEFSLYWIEKNTSSYMLNPVNDLLFKKLMENQNEEIEKGNKKALFDKDEQIGLKAGTIKSVVAILERCDLYGIDEDLNGRLFETFLNATMRGNDLGQYFTPRSIVKLGVKLANIEINKHHVDKVFDGSCGTGGFLIDAFCSMKETIMGNGSYSDSDRRELLEQLNSSIFGIDAAKDPKLARIARINMDLHGGGCSQIYIGDTLNKTMIVDKTDSKEFQDEMKEMSTVFKNNTFDVVITNPPFSMEYNPTDEDQYKILKQYTLAKIGEKNGEPICRTLRAGVMFIERYYDLLKPGGKLISVIDNTVLNSEQYDYVRDYIRERFIVKAVISLHGDAFQQSNARVKTSMIYLEKKKDIADVQPDVFMEFSVALGVDDKPITTNPEVVAVARNEAKTEINKILSEFRQFLNGEQGPWRVPSSAISNQLDVKHCIPLKGRYVKKWISDGNEVKRLDELFTEVTKRITPKVDAAADPEHEDFNILTIKYDGSCSIEENRTSTSINGSGYIVEEGDIVFSNYNAYYGAIGYVSDEFAGSFASNSYTVLKPNNFDDGIYAWAVLRTAEIRADMLDSAIGMGRSTIKWEDIRSVQIPYLKDEKERKKIVNKVFKAWANIKKAKLDLEKVKADVGNVFGTESPESYFRFNANKPPK